MIHIDPQWKNKTREEAQIFHVHLCLFIAIIHLRVDIYVHTHTHPHSHWNESKNIGRTISTKHMTWDFKKKNKKTHKFLPLTVNPGLGRTLSDALPTNALASTLDTCSDRFSTHAHKPTETGVGVGVLKVFRVGDKSAEWVSLLKSSTLTMSYLH